MTKRPYRTALLSRAHHAKIVPERLTAEELLALFEWSEAPQEGEVLWWKD